MVARSSPSTLRRHSGPAGLPVPAPTRWPALREAGQLVRLTGLSEAIGAALSTRRAVLLLPFLVIGGIVLSLQVPGEMPLWLSGGGGLLALLLGWLSRNHLQRLRLVTALGAVWLGLSLLPLHGALHGTAMLAFPAYGSYQFRVDEVLTTAPDGIRAIVSGITPLAEARALPIRRARLVVAGDAALGPGDVLSARVRFYPVPGPVIPHGFDTQFHAYFDGIGAYGTTLGEIGVVARGSDMAVARVIDGIRRGIAARIDAALPQPSAGIARALITGDQSEVPEDARDTMATAGLAHVLSVSGLHLTLVAGLVLASLRGGLAFAPALHRLLPVKRLAALGAIGAALAYFAISGGNIAAQRSTIMIVLVLGAVLFGRQALTMRNVAIAALIILVTDPPGIFRPSFQLSFAAVIALIGAWELMRPDPQRDRAPAMRLLAYFGGIALTSLVAGLATLLFSIYHFQQTSPLGIIGNLVSLSLVGFVMMPSALIATLLMPLGLEQPLLWIMGWSIDRMLDLGALVAGWSEGIDASPLLQPLALLLGLAALAWFTFLESWHRLVGPALLVPAVALLALDSPPDLLVADTTQAIAMRGGDGLVLVAGRADTFAVEIWRETYTEPIPAAALLGCDSVGCFGDSPLGFTVAIATRPAAFYEDCALADLVLSRRSAPAGCSAPLVIDADALQQRGMHWLRWDPKAGRFEVRTGMEGQARPWRLAPR